MKKLLSLLFLMMIFSSISYAEWKVVSFSADGDAFYVDFSKIKKSKGYVYYWHLLDRVKPTKYGDLSTKRLNELDCNTPRRQRSLSGNYFTQPMGEGTPSVTDNTTREWVFPPPNSSVDLVINAVCSY